MLNFVWLEDGGGGVVAQLNDKDWSELHEELAFLKSKTGVWLDPYSDTRIAPDHAKLLVNAIHARHHKRPNIVNLARVLDESIKSDRWLLAVGD